MEDICYQVIRSDRKTIALQILPDGAVLVRCPRRMPTEDIRRFVAEKEGWIRKHIPSAPSAPKLTPSQLQALSRQAAYDLPARVAAYARRIGVSYGRITIRHQKTRWGSCSSKGNLNFNCMLMLAPAAVVDYVVIHELCHRKEMNHSKAFWALVQQHCPDYLLHRRWLKEHGRAILSQMP